MKKKSDNARAPSSLFLWHDRFWLWIGGAEKSDLRVNQPRARLQKRRRARRRREDRRRRDSEGNSNFGGRACAPWAVGFQVTLVIG